MSSQKIERGMTRRDQLTAELDTIQDEIDLNPTPELRRRRDALAREINIIDNAAAALGAEYGEPL
jgi:hypothetical protein